MEILPSASNPADLLSCGVAVGALVDECSIWWKGPKWLCLSADTWLVWSSSSNHVEHEIYQEGMEAVCMATGEPSSSLLNVIDPERYSSLNKLLAVTSHVIRFTTNWKNRPLTTQELSIAMTLWTKAIQGQAFSPELQQLAKKNSNLSLPLIRHLHLYLDDSAVLRCWGRLESAPLDDQSKSPVLLPRNEHFTKLVALAAHAQVLHSGARETLVQLRQKYWVPRGRQFVRSLVRKCVTCWKTDGPPYQPVSSPPLPPSRVSEGQAFSTTGVDYASLWREQYPTRSLRSLVRYCSCHSNKKFISSRHRVISSISVLLFSLVSYSSSSCYATWFSLAVRHSFLKELAIAKTAKYIWTTSEINLA